MRLGGLAALALVAGGCGDDVGGFLGKHAPQIASHPANRTVLKGETATFTVAATGSGTLTYQWKKNGANVVGGTGGTTPSYTTPPTTLADSGAQFMCIVTNDVGAAESNAATLTIRIPIVAVAAGYYHSLALKNDGTVWAWGANGSGQLGDGTTTDRLTPVQVVGPGGSGWFTDVQAVAAGLHHSLALKTDGTVWAWGANWYGQLGDGTTTDSSTPVQSGP